MYMCTYLYSHCPCPSMPMSPSARLIKLFTEITIRIKNYNIYFLLK